MIPIPSAPELSEAWAIAPFTSYNKSCHHPLGQHHFVHQPTLSLYLIRFDWPWLARQVELGYTFRCAHRASHIISS